MQILFSIYDLAVEATQTIEQAQACRDAITCRLPGIRMLLSGSLRSGLDSWGVGRHVAGASLGPVPGRGELLAFSNDVAAKAAFQSPVGRELVENERASLKNQQTFSIHGQAVIPLDAGTPGRRCTVSIAGLNFDPEYGSFEHAEHHYVAEHSRLAARLPGSQGYLIGIVEREPGAVPKPEEPHRLTIGVFDDEESLQLALKSPAAADLEQDARGFAKIALLYFLDATIRL